MPGARRRSPEKALARLTAVKADFVSASNAAARKVRSCEGCDARCCREGLNSMRVSRIEAVALRRRLEEPDLAPRVKEILDRARDETRRRRLESDPEATYDCPLLSPEGLCLVHGPAQPAGCLTFRPVDDGGCDHDLGYFRKNITKVSAAEKSAFGKVSEPLPIPVALLRVFRSRAAD